MYSYEDRKRAVELYIQYNLSAAAAVIRELGYNELCYEFAVTVVKQAGQEYYIPGHP